jgi:acetyl esterase/lipase
MVGLLGDAGDLQAARAAIEDLNAQIPTPDGVRVRPVTAGGVPGLVVSPASAPPATVLYLHGGGYVLGSAFGYQPHAGALALAAQAGILVPDYRLAPEHPYPAAVEDGLRAYRWLIERQDPETVILAGDSCGAGLVMSLLLMLRRDGLPLPGAGVLLCPWLDLDLAGAPETSEIPGAGLDEARRCVDMYLNGHDPDDPLVAPLKADLTGLPPLLVQAATGDARLADAKAIVAHARDQGVDARLELYPVDAHAFHLFWSFLPEAADAMEAAGRFIAASAAQHDGAQPVRGPHA